MTEWTQPADLDPEVADLCAAMNRIPGIQTTSSCCGHGNYPYRIYFDAEQEALPHLLYWLDVCHNGFNGWRAIARTDCAKSPVYYLVEGPIGQVAYDQSKRIAELIDSDRPTNGQEE